MSHQRFRHRNPAFLRAVVAVRFSAIDDWPIRADLEDVSDTATPPQLRPLAKLLKRRKISEIEFNAAVAYFGMTDDRRAAVENKMRDAPREIVRNILASGVNISEAMTRVAPAHSAAATYRLRATLAELSEAIEMAERPSARTRASV